jgi:asparagine synthase (glutamine-hydrolysing)
VSVIFGVINFNNTSVTKDIEQKMINKLNIYKLDNMRTINSNNIMFGCGIQHITPESLHEILPYYDTESGLTITADAIIDNRKELLSVLCISQEIRNNVTDSQLILLAYKKWGTECCKYLVGDFAFVIWDEKEQSLFCARDHVGKRTFYYYYDKGIFTFGTVIKPIFEALSYKPELNKKWIADYLALPLTIQEINNNETIYKNIYQLQPACTIILKNKEIYMDKYWNPIEDVKPLKLKSDKEYEEAFNKVFFEAVNCRLRSTREVGVMLSGGLDSGSVACVAAMKLKKESKRLKAFSSVPISDYKDYLPEYSIADESEYIQSIVDMYKNIDLKLCRGEDKNSVTDIDFLIDVLEQPHKIIENLFWYNNIIENAARDDCKVLLNGQGGNMTISYGYFMTQAISLLRKGRLLKTFREINGYSKLHNISNYYVTRAIFKAAIPYNLRKFVRRKTYRNKDIFEMTPINFKMIDQWDVEKRIKEKGYYNYPTKYINTKEMRKYVVDSTALSQIALVETKLTLAHGIVKRDPTSDKRIIEFCVSLPDEQFVKNGQERYLIRRAMEGILPDKIRLNYEKRGQQSADWIQRLQPKWQSVRNELQEILEDDTISQYINIDKLKKHLNSLDDYIDEKSEQSIRLLLVTLIFEKFIKAYTC